MGEKDGVYELDGRHSPICFFRELTPDFAVDAFRTAGRLRRIALS